MRSSSFSVFFTLVVAAFASSADVHYVVHEKRELEHPDWLPASVEVDRSTTILLSIALTQRNLEHAQDFLLDVSDPFSPNYGKHWSAQKVGSNNLPGTLLTFEGH